MAKALPHIGKKPSFLSPFLYHLYDLLVPNKEDELTIAAEEVTYKLQPEVEEMETSSDPIVPDALSSPGSPEPLPLPNSPPLPPSHPQSPTRPPSPELESRRAEGAGDSEEEVAPSPNMRRMLTRLQRGSEAGRSSAANNPNNHTKEGAAQKKHRSS